MFIVAEPLEETELLLMIQTLDAMDIDTDYNKPVHDSMILYKSPPNNPPNPDSSDNLTHHNLSDLGDLSLISSITHPPHTPPNPNMLTYANNTLLMLTPPKLTTTATKAPASPSSASHSILRVYLQSLLTAVPALHVKIAATSPHLVSSTTITLPPSLLPSLPSVLASSPAIAVIDSDMFSPQLIEMNAEVLLNFIRECCTDGSYILRLRRSTTSGGGEVTVTQIPDSESKQQPGGEVSIESHTKWLSYLTSISLLFAKKISSYIDATPTLTPADLLPLHTRIIDLLQNCLAMTLDSSLSAANSLIPKMRRLECLKLLGDAYSGSDNTREKANECYGEAVELVSHLPKSQLTAHHLSNISQRAVPNLLSLLSRYVQNLSPSSVLTTLHSLVTHDAAVTDARVWEGLGEFISSFGSRNEGWRDKGLSLCDVLDASRDCFEKVEKGSMLLEHVVEGEEEGVGEDLRKAIEKLPLRKRDELQIMPAAYSSFLRAYELSGGTVTPTKKNVTSETQELKDRRRKLGDSCNACGQVCITTISELEQAGEGGETKCDLERLRDASEIWFRRALSYFADDPINTALITLNLTQSLKASQKFAAATACLQIAHGALESREKYPHHWDMVSDNLAAVAITLGFTRRTELKVKLVPGYQVSKKEERTIIEPFSEAIKIYSQLGNQKQTAAAKYQRGLFYASSWKFQKTQGDAQQKLGLAMADLNAAREFFSSMVGEEATMCSVFLSLADVFDVMGANNSQMQSNIALVENCIKCMIGTKPGFSGERDQEIRQLVGFVNTAKLSEANAGEKGYREWRRKVAEEGGRVETMLGRYLMKAAKAEKELKTGDKYIRSLRLYLLHKQRTGSATYDEDEGRFVVWSVLEEIEAVLK